MRPLVPAGALLLLCAATPALATPALAAAAAPTAGSAASALGLLSIEAGGHSIDVATLELLSETLTASPVAKVVVTPLVVDGVAYGQQTVTPGSSPASIPALPTSGIPGLPGVFEVIAPAISASAETPESGPKSTAGAQSIGGLKVLGLPVSIDGAAQAISGVTATASTATKQVSVTDLALPSIADLLAGLGLDLSKVPVDVLLDLVAQLELTVTDALATANATLDGVQDQMTAAANAVFAATNQLSAATSAADAALATLNTQLGLAGLTLAAYEALPQAGKDLLPAALTSAYLANTQALSTQTAAQSVLTVAQAAVDALQATLTAAVAAVFAAVNAVLDGTPLLSLDSFEVSTSAVAKSASAGGQTATITGGEIVGLNVLGTDVLDAVLGSSSIDLLDVTDGVLADVTAVVDGLTATLADVISGVTGITLTPAVVDVLGKATRTGVVGGFGEAETAVSALSITLPELTLPTALSLPGVGSLPAFEGVTAVNGVLESLSGSLDLVTLTELSRFRPAVVAAPPGTNPPAAGPQPTLPTTGGTPAGGLAGLALLAAAAGLVVVRRRTATS